MTVNRKGRGPHPMLMTSLAAFLLLPAVSAHAQDGAAANAAVQDELDHTAATSPADGDIVVTAQKRTERLQDVPISMTVASGEALENAHIVSLYDLPKLVPGLVAVSGTSSAKPAIKIRGIGSAGGTALEPSVASFQDGFYIPREGQVVGAFFDLEAIEVLRGPQGTLFGRNAAVGAISVRSAMPDDEFSGQIQVEAGTGGRYKAEAFVNLPLSDTAQLRLSGIADMLDGYLKSTVDGRRLGGINTFALRGTLNLDLTSSLNSVLRANHARRRGDGFVNYALAPDTFAPGLLQVYLNRFAALGVTNVDLDPFDFKVNAFSGNSPLDEHQAGVNHTLSWESGGGFTVRVLSSYQDWSSDQKNFVGFTIPVPTYSQLTAWDSESYSNELQILSPSDVLLDGRLSFVGGLYQYHERYEYQESFAFFDFACRLILGARPTILPSCLANQGRDVNNLSFDQRTNSLAAYGQLNFKITDTLDVVLGSRWSRDRKRANLQQVVYFPEGSLQAAPETSALRRSDSKITWRANLNWRPNRDILVFATYATGFKSGGFNSTVSNIVLGDRRQLEPETVKNFEIGAKTTWADGLLTLNATGYRMDISNFQDRAFNGISFSVRNAAKVRNQGFELEAIVRPATGATINAGLAYLDSQFLSYPGASPLPGFTGVQDLSGARPLASPKGAGNVGAAYEGDLSGGFALLLRTDLRFVSRQNIGPQNDNNPLTFRDGYALLGAKITLFGSDKQWSVSVFGDNLTDKKYCTGLAYQPFGGAFGVVQPGISPLRCLVGTPRTIGVGANINF